jgi:predicted enzyme involved in methoxymalonyl-ACP biosynthesis
MNKNEVFCIVQNIFKNIFNDNDMVVTYSTNSDYIKTQKNQQVKDFYSRCGFHVIAKSDNTTRYRLEAISYKKKEIEYIRIKNGI